MQRYGTFGLFCLGFVLAGCGQNEPARPVVVVDQRVPDLKPLPVDYLPKIDVPRKFDPNPLPNIEILAKALTPQEKYDAAVARAFHSLSEKKEDAALVSFLEAQAAQDDDFIKGEIERLRAGQARKASAERTAQDIQLVLNAGRAAEAAKLAGDALDQFGATDAAVAFTKLKRQADALLTAQNQGLRSNFLEEAEAARKAKNYRAALLAYDQAVANKADVAAYKETYDDLRYRLNRYDEMRNRAADLRRDSSKLEEAISALEEARKAWETQQVVQEIDEARLAMNNRRDRVAVADFEVIGDVGMPLAGRTIAEELLPHFKSRFDLVERSQVGAILQDLKIDPADLQGNERGRSELGRLAKARFLVVGSVSRLYGTTINARLVDVQSGLIVQTAKIVAGSPAELQAKIPALARILQMSDEQKIAYEQELARAATIEPAPPAPLPPPPQASAPDAIVNPIVVFTPRPPQFGPIVIADFGRFQVLQAQPQAIVIADDSPCRDRAFFVSVELGDNLFRRGRFREAMRHYEFALFLAPGRDDIRTRLDRCRPFLPPVFVANPRPRLAVLPFVEIGQPGFVTPGLGLWTADSIAPYYYPTYDVVDRGEVFWWMGRLGLSLRDLLIDPSARLLLARAMGVRYFLIGNLVETASFNANVELVDAEFNALVGSGTIHVRNPFELKMGLGDLAQLTMMPSEQRVAFVEQRQAAEPRIQEARIQIGRGKWSLAIGIFREELVRRPNCVEARFALIDAERRQRQFELEEARRDVYAREQARRAAEWDRQQALEAEAQRQAAIRREIDEQLLARQQQQAQVSLLFQARNASRGRDFNFSVSLFESASGFNRSADVVHELAGARAQAAEAEQGRMIREQNARDLAFRQQREQGLEAARQAVLADQQRRMQEERERRRADEANAKAAYDRLLDQAEQAKAKGQPEIAISALQTARQLRPSPEIDRLVAAGLVDQAKAAADKMGAEERQKLEAQLAAEQERRQQAELQAAQNKAKYDETIRRANAALTAKNFAVAKQHFQLAAQTLHTDEAVIGLRQADDELAKSQAAANAARKAREEQQRKDAEVARLLAEAKAATAAKQFDKAQQSLQTAIALKPAAVEAQVELIKTQHAKDDHVAQLRKTQEIPKTQPVPMVDPSVAQQAAAEAAKRRDAVAALKAERIQLSYDTAMTRGKAFVTAKQYSQAADAFRLALSFAPNDPAATQALNDARTAMIPPKKETPKVEPPPPPKKDPPKADPIKAAHDQYLTAARAAFGARQFEDAIRQATEALKLMPNDGEAAKIIADSRLAMIPPKKETPKVEPPPPPKKDPPKKEPPKVDPIKAAHDQHLTAARAAFSARQFEEAIRQATEALKLMPNDGEAAKIIADSRLAMIPPKKETPKVEPPPPKKDPPPVKKDPPKVNPVQAQLNQLLQNGAALENQNRYADASKDYQEALKLAPANAELKKKIEFCNGMDGAIKDLTAGRFGEATIGFDLSLKLYPTDANAKRYLELAKGKKK